MTQQRLRVIHSVDWRLVALVLVIVLALHAQGCTVIHAQQVGLVTQSAAVDQVDRAWLTGAADVAHVDSVHATRLEWYPNGR